MRIRRDFISQNTIMKSGNYELFPPCLLLIFINQSAFRNFEFSLTNQLFGNLIDMTSIAAPLISNLYFLNQS